jgi:hypothetical protein
VTTVSTPPAPTRARVRPSERATGFFHEQRPSVLVGGIVAAFLVAVAVRLPWADDLMLHMAVLQRLMDNPLHPGNPIIDVGDGGSSIYYSPYMLALALPGKLVGLSAYSLYKLAALVNIFLLLTGLYRFVRSFSDARWAPPLALIGLLFWWGTTAIAWSGFMSLISLGDTEAYPSTVATALTLHLWAFLNDGGRTLRSPRRMLGVGALLGLILLIHQFTGLSAVVGCAAILLAQHRLVRTWPVLKCLAIGLIAAAVVIAIWPYYHLWSVNQGQVDILDPVHKPLYAHVERWYGLGVVLGLVALALRWWRDQVDALVLMFLGIGAVVAYGGLTQHWSYGRSWPMVMMVCVVAVAIAAAESKPGRIRWAWTVPVAVATAVGVSTQFGALLFLVPNSMQTSVSRSLGARGWIENIPHIEKLDQYFKPDQVVAAPKQLGQFEVAAHGSYSVTPAWYLPEIPRSLQHTRDNALFAMFQPTTSEAERIALLKQYDVTWVLLIPGEDLPNGFPATLTAQEDRYRLYRVIY